LAISPSRSVSDKANIVSGLDRYRHFQDREGARSPVAYGGADQQAGPLIGVRISGVRCRLAAT
jgi:hypothetical protein